MTRCCVVKNNIESNEYKNEYKFKKKKKRKDYASNSQPFDNYLVSETRPNTIYKTASSHKRKRKRGSFCSGHVSIVAQRENARRKDRNSLIAFTQSPIGFLSNQYLVVRTVSYRSRNFRNSPKHSRFKL